jgi:hypothetical protein
MREVFRLAAWRILVSLLASIPKRYSSVTQAAGVMLVYDAISKLGHLRKEFAAGLIRPCPVSEDSGHTRVKVNASSGMLSRFRPRHQTALVSAKSPCQVEDALSLTLPVL